MVTQTRPRTSTPAAASTGQAIELENLSKGSAPPPKVEVPAPSLSPDVSPSHPEGALVNPSPPSTDPLDEPEESEYVDPIPLWPFLCLVLQHSSSTYLTRAYEFASYLYMVILFPTTFVPASLLGIFVTGVGLVWSGWVGGLIDEKRRLAFVRWTVVVQKGLIALAYAAFIVLFLPLRSATSSAWSTSTPTALALSDSTGTPTEHALVYICLVIIILASSGAGLASGGIEVAVQRDWAVTISDNNSRKLTTINTWLRRVDLVSKLVSPLLVSLITTTTSYLISLYLGLAIAVFTLGIELVWIGVVWRAFPVLEVEERARVEARRVRDMEKEESSHKKTLGERWDEFKEASRQIKADWQEFIRMPVFLTSLAMALVFLTTLSFDGIMLSYLKSQRAFGDPFIAGMRGVAVVAGLVGTVAMPLLVRKIGLDRGGAWSLWAQILCLLPPVLTLYIGLPKTAPPGQGPIWNIVLFFTFIALSRIALWSIDLIQLQILQEALRDHPRRNRLTSLQLSLQNLFELSKWGLTLGLNRPDEFKWTALASLISVFTAGIVYTFYLFRTRGHLHHWVFLGGKPHEHDPSATAHSSGLKKWGRGVRGAAGTVAKRRGVPAGEGP